MLSLTRAAHLERTLELCAANQETIRSYRQFGANDRGYRVVSTFQELSGSSATRSKPLPQRDKPWLVHEVWDSRLRPPLPWTVRRFSELWGLIQNGPQFTLMKRWPTASSIASRIMSRGHVSFRAPCWPKAAIPNTGSNLCRALLQRPSASLSVNRRTLYLGHSAAAHASLGQPEVGLDLLDEAIQTAETTDERFFEAELHRLRGKMLLTLGRSGEAEAELRRALTIAQQQQARWWELRAATSLAKHWHDAGKHLEAYSLLRTGLQLVRRGFRHNIFERCQSAPGRAERSVSASNARKLAPLPAEDFETGQVKRWFGRRLILNLPAALLTMRERQQIVGRRAADRPRPPTG
mgnify:CR=1 FL=1